MKLTLDILISTYNDGIQRVPEILLPPIEGIGYVVSMQYTEDQYLAMIPPVLKKREDVRLCFLEGLGLSANRNNTLRHTKADICMLADDDVRYTAEDLQTVRDYFESHADVDVALWQAEVVDGEALKRYPSGSICFSKERVRGYYPSSIEISFRRKSLIKSDLFDVRLGIGSEKTLFGEEEAWVERLRRRGKKIMFEPVTVVKTTCTPKSAKCAYDDERYWFTKGAAMRALVSGRIMPHVVRMVLSEFLRHGVNPFFSFDNIIEGIRYMQRTERLKR